MEIGGIVIYDTTVIGMGRLFSLISFINSVG